MEQNKNTKIIQIFIAVLLILSLGTFGYYFIEDGWSLFESFYMTVITITTVGYGETRELSLYGRLFTVVIIFMGIGIVALSAGQLASFIINREIKSLLGREKITKQLKKLKNHFIICGYNNISKGLCSDFKKRNIPFIVISNEINESIMTDDGFIILCGDATKDDVLLNAGIKGAKGLVVCSNTDVDNLYISLAGKELNKDIKIVTICSDPQVESRMIRAGADVVVYPLKLGGEQVAKEIMHHYGKETSTAGGKDNSVYGFYLEYYFHFEDEHTTVNEIKKKLSVEHILALILENGDKIDNPNDEFIVSKNDSLILVMHDQSQKIRINKKQEVLKWSSNLSVGIIALDKDHKHLIDLINKIETALKNNESKRAVNQVFDEIFEYTIIHFNNEEVLFEKYDYPEFDWHKKIHQGLLKKVTELDAVRSFISPESLVAFLKSWIKHHIMEDDKRYSDYLVSKGAK